MALPNMQRILRLSRRIESFPVSMWVLSLSPCEDGFLQGKTKLGAKQLLVWRVTSLGQQTIVSPGVKLKVAYQMQFP